MAASATRTIQEIKPLTLLQRIADKDQASGKDCVDAYGDFIWALARKFTSSTEEAEAAAREIFTDIWRYAELGDENQTAENVLIAMIARRRLIKYLQ